MRIGCALGSCSLPVALVATLASAGCGENAPSPASTAAPVTSPPTPATSTTGEARPRWDEPSFELVAEPPSSLVAGQEARVSIRLTARGNYHVNQDYPISIQVTAPAGVSVPRATLARADAAEFDEEHARFEFALTAPSGHHELRALVDFAVCTPESCMPDTRTLSIALDVP